MIYEKLNVVQIHTQMMQNVSRRGLKNNRLGSFYSIIHRYSVHGTVDVLDKRSSDTDSGKTILD